MALRSAYTHLLVLLAILMIGACALHHPLGETGDAGTTPEPEAGADADCTFTNCNGALSIDPPSAKLVVRIEDGKTIQLDTQKFTVKAGAEDVTDQVAWSFGNAAIGDVTTGSTFTPTGKAGGTATLTARVEKTKITAIITVSITNTIVGVSAGDRKTLDGSSTTDPAVKIVYPQDDTFFPRGVLGPEMQWNGAVVNDVYKLEIADLKGNYDYIEYFGAVAQPESHAVVDQDWTSIASSVEGAKGDPLTVTLTRASGGQAYKSTQHWHIAEGSLAGIVYYYSMPTTTFGAGQNPSTTIPPGIRRIKLDGTSSTIAIPSGWTPNPRWSGQQCWGCHSVSRDGKKLVATFEGVDANLLATINLNTDGTTSAGTIAPKAPDTAGVLGDFNPAGDKIVFSAEGMTPDGHFTCANGPINVMDMTGKVVAKDLMGQGGCSEPAWSPDGTLLTATCKLGGANCSNGWWWESNSSEIWIAKMSGTNASGQKLIVPSTVGTGGRLEYPDFSSDSKWIAFTQIAKDEVPLQLGKAAEDGYLWLTDVDGTTIRRLDIASGNGRSQYPKFAPLRAGGYQWIVFASHRDYGNKLVGKNRGQLWIAAIDDPPNGTDPSHPAFYLRGQDSATKNMQAQFRLPPCKATNASCTTGSDCCEGQCNKNPTTKEYVCGPPLDCADEGNGCTSDASCCVSNAKCIDGFCRAPIIP